MKKIQHKPIIVKKNSKKKISNKTLLLILMLYFILDALLITKIIIPAYANYPDKTEEEIQEEILKTATIKVETVDDLNVTFYSEVKVSDFIVNINGTIVDDYIIDTKKIGKEKIKFEYINDENIKIPYAFTINVVDDVSPEIWLGSTYSVKVGYEGNLIEDITCADNFDDNPKCEIIGQYNTQIPGDYKLIYKATDSSKNVTEKEFTLKVKEQFGNSNSTQNSTQKNKMNIRDIIKEYKTEKTSIGIDVSSWQGEIDFQKVKDSGVEFVFIRVGSAKGDRDNVLDKQFTNYIKGFTKVGIPVGIYYYSYASSRSIAISDAKWVLNQIKGYKVELPIVYDWENWSFYNEFNQSYYTTSMNAKAFLDTIKKAGYDGMLYSSASYLKKVWFDIDYPVWLAHYTNKTNYTGQYTYWQMCSNGIVPGIMGDVDINIYYKEKEE